VYIKWIIWFYAVLLLVDSLKIISCGFETCRNTQCDIIIRISKEQYCAFFVLCVANWLSTVYGMNSIKLFGNDATYIPMYRVFYSLEDLTHSCSEAAVVACLPPL
jgi:hypothetical protein